MWVGTVVITCDISVYGSLRMASTGFMLLLFNRKDAGEMLPKERVFNVPNTDGFIEEGKKVPKKTRPICIRGIDVDIPIDAYTAAGWPAVGGAAMKVSINR
jgi:hypothetical protein